MFDEINREVLHFLILSLRRHGVKCIAMSRECEIYSLAAEVRNECVFTFFVCFTSKTTTRDIF